jgi:hypothetical protein
MLTWTSRMKEREDDSTETCEPRKTSAEPPRPNIARGKNAAKKHQHEEVSMVLSTLNICGVQNYYELSPYSILINSAAFNTFSCLASSN